MKFDRIWLFCAHFLGSVYLDRKPFFIFKLSILSRKSLWKSKLHTLPGRMLLIWPKNSKSKYQNDSLSSVTSQKKMDPKSHIFTLYRTSHSEDLGIPDLRSISIGVPTVKRCDFWSIFLGGSKKWESRFDTFPSTFSFGSKAIEPGTYLLSISKEISVSISIAAK